MNSSPTPSDAAAPPADRTSRLAWSVLAYTVAVVLWGAIVRATGSGAGCGSHWPLCNGQVLPRAQEIATRIEFAHRLTSGLSLILIAWLGIAVFHRRPAGHPARRAAVASVAFILTEALIGAGLVLMGWVTTDQSTGRAVALALHLANTFLLLAALGATALTTRPGWVPPAAPRLRWRSGHGIALGALLALFLASGVTGAIAALGDTLFPAGNLGLLDAVRADFSDASHFLVRLRVLHPLFAVTAALAALYHAQVFRPFHGPAARAGDRLGLAVAAQVALGFLNLAWKAPTWLQVVHLGMADVVWILLVTYAWQARWSAESYGAATPSRGGETAAPPGSLHVTEEAAGTGVVAQGLRL
jgi:heme A synthase